MRESLRTLRAILGTAMAVDRRATILVFVIGVVAWVGNAAQALTVAFFVQAFTVHDATLAWLAVIANAIAFGANNYLFSQANAIGITLQEKTTHALDRRIQALMASIEGVDLLERPDYLDRLSTLRAQTYWFGNVTSTLQLPQVLLNVVATAILLFAIDPPLALVPLAGLPAFSLNGRGEALHRRAEERVAASRRMRRRLLELGTDPDAAAETRLFGTRGELLDRFLAADATYRHELNRAELAGTLLSILGWLIFAVAFAASFVVVATGIRDGHLPIAALFATVYLVRLASFQASVSLNTVAALRRTVTATGNLLWLNDRVTEERPASPRTAPVPDGGALRFDGLTFRYPGASTDALDDVAFEVPAGSTLAIVGDNGAGKTTLVKLLARFYDPTAGRITLGGTDIASIDVPTWRAGLTACLQDFSRFEFVLRETVGVGRLAEIEDAASVRRAIEAAGAADVSAGLADEIETQLGTGWEGGADLSTGQWQKLALGRAMMRSTPRLLLLDEPTAALDAIAEARLFERYAAASDFAHATGAITIIVSHRMSTVRMADRIAVIEHGRLRQVGPHEALIAADGPYRELFTTQAAAYGT
jgi:ATP-binding cassette subfamily B protein